MYSSLILYMACLFFKTDQLPTVTAVIRGPFGRHAWTMQLRQLPRNKQVTMFIYWKDCYWGKKRCDCSIL